MKKQKIKKDNAFLDWIKFLAIVAIIVGGIYSTLTFVPFFNTKQYYVIVSNSMVPTFEIGDVVFMDKNFNPDDLVENQIIAFYEDVDNCGIIEIVVHYIADVRDDGDGTISFKTKREGVTSSEDWDWWTIPEEDVVGVYYAHLPWVGKVLLFADTFFGKVVIAVDFIIIYLIIDFFKQKSKASYI